MLEGGVWHQKVNRVLRPQNTAKTHLICSIKRRRRAAPACPLGRRFQTINTLKRRLFTLSIFILNHPAFAPTQAGTALIASKTHNYAEALQGLFFDDQCAG